MAHQLGKGLQMGGHDIVDIWNRTISKAESLAPSLKAKAQENIDDLRSHVDLLIIAVSDDAISLVAEQLNADKWKDTIVVHTSGSVSSSVLGEMKNYGSFYPFQSMTAGQDMDFSEVPILISTNNSVVDNLLQKLAESISDNVYPIKDEQRAIVHIAGVFANNFTNQMLAISKSILDKNQLSFDIVKPLIMKTIDKLSELDPKDAQTGPAVRRDQQTIKQHLEFLSSDSNLHDVYEVVSKSIIELHNSDD